jgi:hypothetical protein
MANNAFPYTPELKPFQDAEDAWTAEVRRIFGKRAGDARYTAEGKGIEGSTLRKLHDAREAARLTWHRSAA